MQWGAEAHGLGSVLEGKWALQAPLALTHSEWAAARHHGRTESAADGGPVYVFIED